MGKLDKVFGKGETESIVTDECIATLKAASEVIGEKCKFEPRKGKKHK